MSQGIDPSLNPLDWSADGVALLSPYLLAALAAATAAWWKWRHRPILSVDGGIDRQELGTFVPNPHGVMTPGPKAVYARLVLRNRQRQNPAEDAHVLIRSYERVTPAALRATTIMRMPLAWTHSTPTATVTTLHGGSPRFIDLVAVHQGHQPALLQTDPEAAPPIGWLDPVDGQGKRVASAWKVNLELVGKGVKPIHFSVQVSWDGDWSSGSGLDHLHVDGPVLER
jgi:hypothetical protein